MTKSNLLCDLKAAWLKHLSYVLHALERRNARCAMTLKQNTSDQHMRNPQHARPNEEKWKILASVGLLSKLTYKKSPSIAKFSDITNLVVACVFGAAVAYWLGITRGKWFMCGTKRIAYTNINKFWCRFATHCRFAYIKPKWSVWY
jgi:hypothetical protein